MPLSNTTRRWLLYAAVVAVFGVWFVQARAASTGQGVTATGLLRGAGLVAAVLGIVVLILVEFVYRDSVSGSFYHWTLLFGLFALPGLALLGTTETVFEETKTVASCNTCHVMNTFVNDMRDPESPTLAARHYKNNWISTHQCYECHTTYGVHGTLAAKRDGFRHWLLYVTDTYDEPIQYSGSYPNANCTSCHAGTSTFEAVDAHSALRAELSADEVSCARCHGPPHPAPPDRPHPPQTADATDE